MIIGIDASRANKDFKTGTEWYSYYLIINLIELDRQNKYILYSDKPLNEAFLSSLNLEKNSHVKIKVLNWPFKYLWTLGRMSLEMIFSRPDVLFIPAHVLPFFFPKKTINTIHDIAFVKNNCLYNQEMSVDNSKNSDFWLNFLVKFFTFGKYQFKSTDYLNWSTKFALKRAKKIIAVSNFTKKEILDNYRKIDSEKIAVVHNGYIDSLYKIIDNQESTELVFKKYGIDYKFFLYVGRLERKKNIYNLIEAFSIYKENNNGSEKLVLIGSAGYGYDEMKYMIEELGIEKEVIVLGWVEEEDLPYIFNKAEIFIFPSLYEGFGIPVIQAMACGAPVLLSNIDVLQEVAQDAALFFDCHNSADLAQKIELIQKDKDLKKDLVEKGLLRCQNFSWKKCAQETLDIINNL